MSTTHPVTHATTYSVYRLDTGALTGQTLCLPSDEAAASTPPGCGLVEGAWHHERHQVDLSTATVQPLAPVKPADTADHTWHWHEPAGRFVPAPTLQRQRLDLIALIDAAIARAEGNTDRAVRELLLASELQAPARARIEAIEAAVVQLRALRTAALLAANEAELALLPRDGL